MSVRVERKKSFFLCWTLALSLCLPTAAWSQSFANNSFEADDWYDPPGSIHNPTISGWSSNPNGGYLRAEHTSLAAQVVPHGVQAIVLDGGAPCNNGRACDGHGYIEQTVSDFWPGDTYRLTFSISSEVPSSGAFGTTSPGRVRLTVVGATALGPSVFEAGQDDVEDFWHTWATHFYDFIPSGCEVTFRFEHVDPVTNPYYSGVALDQLLITRIARQDCITPPEGMIGWWGLDEISGPVAHEIVGANNAIQTTVAASPLNGPVLGAYRFSDLVGSFDAPFDEAINPKKNFSIDVWVRAMGGDPTGNPYFGNIVSGPAKDMRYELGILSVPSTPPRLSFGFVGASDRHLVDIDWAVGCAGPSSPKRWRHIAVVYARFNRVSRIWVDGELVSSYQHLPVGGPPITGPVSIGGGYGMHPVLDIDEVEIFDRMLAETVIQSIFMAGSGGKCKTWLSICPSLNYRHDAPDGAPRKGKLTIENRHATPSTYEISIDGLGPYSVPNGISCDALWPPGSFDLPISTVTVDEFSEAEVSYTVYCPPSFGVIGPHGCYIVRAADQTHGETGSVSGYITRLPYSDAPYVSRPCADLVVPGGSSDSTATNGIGFRVRNDEASSQNVFYEIAEMVGGTDSTWTVVSLAGLSPGVPLRDSVMLSAGSFADIEVPARADSGIRFTPNRLIFRAGTAGYGSMSVLAIENVRAGPYSTILATAGAGGAIDPSGEVDVFQGRDQRFSITPDSGQVVSEVTVDGSPLGGVGGYHFRTVREPHEISAQFSSVLSVDSRQPSSVDLDLSPNPSFGRVQIEYELPRSGTAVVTVHDLAGREVARLARGWQREGHHRVMWEFDKAARKLPAGVYFLRLSFEGRAVVRKVVIAN